MRRTPRVMASVSLCLLALAGGCDSDDGGGGGQLLTNLSVADFNKHCAEIQDWEEKNVTFTPEQECTFGTYFVLLDLLGQGAMAKDEASLRMACTELKTECMTELMANAGKPPMMMPTEREMCEVPPSTCKATVGEYDACRKSIPDQFKKYLAGLPACDKLTIQDTMDLLDPNSTKFEVEDSAACKTFEMKCPAMGTPSMSSMMTKP